MSHNEKTWEFLFVLFISKQLEGSIPARIMVNNSKDDLSYRKRKSKSLCPIKIQSLSQDVFTGESPWKFSFGSYS